MISIEEYVLLYLNWYPFCCSDHDASADASPEWRTVPTKMTSSEAFVETMVAHGTKNIFGIVGSAFMDALDIFEPAGIRFVPVQVSNGKIKTFDIFC